MKKIKKIISSLAAGADRTLCVLNGVFGDSFEDSKYNLGIKMSFYYENKPVKITKTSLRKIALPNSNKICILMHGSCGSEKGWNFKKGETNNYGSLLQQDFGYVPFFVRYNSGLHISTNGKHLSYLLEKLVCAYPHQVSELILVGHSMGGLVFRSACYYGQKNKCRWIKLVRKIFYLGSPHLGTHLEKLGKLSMSIINQIPNPITKLLVTLGDLRSAGVKDMRHGYLIEEDWKNKNSENLFYWHQHRIPLLKRAKHYLICGTLSKVENSAMGRWFGDGLVHPASAFGKGLFSSSKLPFLEEHCKIISGITHPRLQRSNRVYQEIKHWCNY